MKVSSDFLLKVLFSDNIGILWVICLKVDNVVFFIFWLGEFGFWSVGYCFFSVISVCIFLLYIVLGIEGLFII